MSAPTSGLGNVSQILFLDATHTHCLGIHKVLDCSVVDALRSQNHIRARLQDKLNALLHDVFLTEQLLRATKENTK